VLARGSDSLLAFARLWECLQGAFLTKHTTANALRFSRMSEGLDGVSMSSSTSLGSSGPKAHFSAKLTVNGVLSEMKCDYKMKS